MPPLASVGLFAETGWRLAGATIFKPGTSPGGMHGLRKSRAAKRLNVWTRVLIHRGARDLTAEEIDRISGGIHTLTPCTAGSCSTLKDGDAAMGVCGC